MGIYFWIIFVLDPGVLFLVRFVCFFSCTKTLVSIWSSRIEQNPRICSGATSKITCYNGNFVCGGWIVWELDLWFVESAILRSNLVFWGWDLIERSGKRDLEIDKFLARELGWMEFTFWGILMRIQLDHRWDCLWVCIFNASWLELASIERTNLKTRRWRVVFSVLSALN